MAGEHEFVVLGNLFGHGLGAVIELLEAVLVGHGVVPYPPAQMAAEGLGHWEDDAPLLYGVALYVVKLAVGVGIVVGIQTVEVHGFEQCGVLEVLLRKIVEIDAGGVTQVFDVQAEFLFLHAAGSQVVDVLHHQSPSG